MPECTGCPGRRRTRKTWRKTLSSGADRTVGSFRAEAKFSTWLCRIAINACLNWRARESRRTEIHTRWAGEVLVQGGASAEPADDVSVRVQAALNRLPAKQRAAMVLTTYEELSHAEAARVMGGTEATVSWRVFAARQKLKRWLKTPQAK